MIKHFDNLIDLFRAFPTEESCIDHLRAIRWRDGEYCPHCGHGKIYKFKRTRLFKCGGCNVNFSIRVGTIFEDSRLPLQKWFAAIWLITNHPKGIASTTLAKDLKVTQKTAWFILHRLRYATGHKSFNKPLSGIVEIDDGFFGGGGKGPHGKTQVIGAVERQGDVVARVVPLGLGKPEAQQFIDETISPSAKMVVTDSGVAYRSLEGIKHKMVNHSRGGGYRGKAHTQTIESVWSQLKRQIVGVHHWVSPKHLQSYINEMAWRLNQRTIQGDDRVSVLLSGIGGRLTYRDLIS